MPSTKERELLDMPMQKKKERNHPQMTQWIEHVTTAITIRREAARKQQQRKPHTKHKYVGNNHSMHSQGKAKQIHSLSELRISSKSPHSDCEVIDNVYGVIEIYCSFVKYQ